MLKLDVDFENPATKTENKNDDIAEIGQKRKLSGDGDSDDDEDFSKPLSKVQLLSRNAYDAKKPIENKREFRLEDAFEDHGYRKRKMLKKADPFGGTNWLRINGYHPKQFDVVNIPYILILLQLHCCCHCQIFPSFRPKLNTDVWLIARPLLRNWRS